MARPRTFDKDKALEAAIATFREHGYEGTSAQMLVKAMGIARQSLYDTFGDKWQLYCAALRRYVSDETQAHIAALQADARALGGIEAMIDRVIADSHQACLGVNAVCEFGRSQPELVKIHDAATRVIRAAIAARIQEAQAEGDVPTELAAEDIADFLAAGFVSIRIAARGGADDRQLHTLKRMALRALH